MSTPLFRVIDTRTGEEATPNDVAWRHGDGFWWGWKLALGCGEAGYSGYIPNEGWMARSEGGVVFSDGEGALREPPEGRYKVQVYMDWGWADL